MSSEKLITIFTGKSLCPLRLLRRYLWTRRFSQWIVLKQYHFKSFSRPLNSGGMIETIDPGACASYICIHMSIVNSSRFFLLNVPFHVSQDGVNPRNAHPHNKQWLKG